MGYENCCIVIDRCIFFVKIQLKVEFFTYIKENTTFFFFRHGDRVFIGK